MWFERFFLPLSAPLTGHATPGPAARFSLLLKKLIHLPSASFFVKPAMGNHSASAPFQAGVAFTYIA
jgi:hypothetical protein